MQGEKFKKYLSDNMPLTGKHTPKIPGDNENRVTSYQSALDRYKVHEVAYISTRPNLNGKKKQVLGQVSKLQITHESAILAN